jgi:ABC-type transport system involved in multi-copper enzyme maturation permease subunit
MKNALNIAHTVWLEMLRRKDMYVVLILLAFLTLTLSSINSFGTDIPSTYIMDVGLLSALLLSCILAVTLTVRQIPSEEQSGTLFTVMTKPIGRFEFLLGKWLGTFSALLLATLLFYLTVIAVTLSRGFQFNLLALAQTYALHCTLLGIIAAIALCFSTYLSIGASSSLTFASIAVGFGFLPKIPHLMLQESGWRAGCMWIIYYAAPHLELFDMRQRLIHNWGPLNASLFAGTLLYGALIITVFLGLAWCIFRKRRFKRGRFA